MKKNRSPKPDPERALRTTEMIRNRSSDLERWSKSVSLAPAWSRRAKIVGGLIAPNTTVLDLGAGAMDLRHHLPETCTYIPSDIVKRAPNTIVADLNLGEFPEVTADYVTLLGVLEYIHEPRAVLLKARTRSSKLILSYCTSNGFLTGKRRGMGWVNDYKLQEIVELITSAGWTIKIRKLYKFRPTMREYIFFAEGN